MSLPPDAQQRLDALRRFLVVDAPEEDELDRLVRLAATVYGVAYAVLTLREGDAERVAYVHGTAPDTFGEGAALMDLPPGPRLPFSVADASADARFARNPLVHGAAGVRFCAAVPLKSVHDFTIGTLAILDPEAQEMNGEGLALLVDLGALVEPVLNLRQVEAERDAARRDAEAAAAERDAPADDGPWAALLDLAPAPLAVAGPDGALLYANAATRALLGLGDAVSGGHLADHLDDASEPPLGTLLVDPSAAAEVCTTDGRAFRLTAAPADAAGAGAVLVAFREAASDADALAAVEADRDAVAAALVGKERELEARSTELLTATATLAAKEAELEAAAAALHAHEEALRAAAAELHHKETALAAAADALAARDAEADAYHAHRLALCHDRDALAAAVHHELRSALTGVLGYAEMLADDDAEDDPHREIGRTMVAASERLLRLLSGTLHLGRLDADEPPLEVVEAAPLVEMAVEPFRTAADARDLALYAELPAEPLYALADAGAVVSIIESLLSNALAHTTQGGIRIRLAASDDDVTVEVQDTGAGMDEAALTHVLTAAPRGIDRRGGGHGVGLALARRLAERMGAQILATSVPGQGSVFALQLPTAPAPAAPALPGGDGALAHPAA